MNHWIGIAIVVLPVLLIGAAILKRPVWWFLLALTVVGLGYLEFTGATREIGNAVLVEVNQIFPTGFDPEPAAGTDPTETPSPAIESSPDSQSSDVIEPDDPAQSDTDAEPAGDGAPAPNAQ